MLNTDTIKITPEMLRLVSAIDEFKGTWRALEAHTTALQMIGDVAAHGQNLQSMLAPLQNIALSENLIRKLQSVLNAQKGMADYRAEHFPMVVQAGSKMIGSLDSAAPDDIAALMPKLVEWLNGAMKSKDVHPLIIAGLFMAVFLQIFPFEKGNQKLARFLVLLILLKSDYDYMPFATLDDIWDARLKEYYAALSSTQNSVEQGKPDWTAWLTFFLSCLAAQKEKLEAALNAKAKDISNLPALSGKVMRLFEKHKRLQMNDIVKFTKGKRSTLKLRLAELVDDGYLRRHGKARATWYSRV